MGFNSAFKGLTSPVKTNLSLPRWETLKGIGLGYSLILKLIVKIDDFGSWEGICIHKRQPATLTNRHTRDSHEDSRTGDRKLSDRRDKGRSCELSCPSKTFRKWCMSILEELIVTQLVKNIFNGNLGTKFLHWAPSTTSTQVTFHTAFLQV